MSCFWLILTFQKLYSKSSNFFDSFETYPYSEPERLEWSLTDEHVEKVNEARQRHDQ